MQDGTGEWTTLSVRAMSRAAAVKGAIGEARRAGRTVADVACATRQGRESHVWTVALRLAR